MCSRNFPRDILVRENCSSGCWAMRMCVGFPCFVPVSTLNIQMWRALSVVHAHRILCRFSYSRFSVDVVDKATFNRLWLSHVEKNFRFRWFMSDTIKGWICEIPKLSWASLPSAKTCDADSVFNAGKIESTAYRSSPFFVEYPAKKRCKNTVSATADWLCRHFSHADERWLIRSFIKLQLQLSIII